jgi:hypothetical protein
MPANPANPASNPMQWWQNYASSLLGLINPASSIENQISYHTQQIPGPQIPVAPTPERWWNPAMPHPLYPAPQGPPPDFGGTVLPNQNNVRALADTQAPADQLRDGHMSTDNFRGKAPVRTAFPTLNGLLRLQ